MLYEVITQMAQLLDRHFEGGTYTLSHLFKDERQRIIGQIIAQRMDELLDTFRAIYQDHLALLRFLREAGMAIPAPLAAASEQIINAEALRLLEEESGDAVRLRELIAASERFELKLDESRIAYAASLKSHRLLAALAADPQSLELLRHAVDGVRLLRELPFGFDLWQAQNLYLEVRDSAAMSERNNFV